LGSGLVHALQLLPRPQDGARHTRNGGDDLSEGSFASDEKPTKEEARKLMRLIRQATLAPSKR